MARTNIGALVATIATLVLTTTTLSSTPVRFGTSELRAFVESIEESVAAEFAADLLIRAASSRRAATEDSAWLAQVLERAFTLGGKAQEPRRRRALPWTHGMTIDAVVTMGRASGLDTTSLQIRAINGLLSLDPHRAIELLKRVPTAAPRLECTDTLMYDAEPPYEAMAALIRSLQAPPPNLRNTDDERLARELLQSRIADIGTSAELAPAMSAVLMVNLPSPQINAVLTTLTERLRSIHDDDWTFTGNLLRTWDAVERFVVAFGSTHRVSVADLLGSFRSYVVTHFQTRRCSLTGHDSGAILDMEQTVITRANMLLAAHNQPLLRREDLRGSHTIASVRPSELWRSPQASRVWEALGAFGMIEMSASMLAPQRKVARAQLSTALYEWTTADERSSRLYFHQRCLALITAARGDNVLRAEALDELAALMSRYAESVRPVEWITHVTAVLDAPHANTVMRRYAQKAFEKSGHPILMRYARLEAILH
jgi:hypothetical protein